MNIQQYIESGIVESYLLGLCSEREARTLESLLPEYPQLQVAMTEAEQTLEIYANQYALAPTATTKVNIFAAIEKLEQEEEKKASKKSTPPQHPTVVQMLPNWYRYFPAVAASLLLMLGMSAYYVSYYYLQYQKANKEVVALQSEKQTLVDVSTKRDNQLRVVRQANVHIEMKGTPLSAESSVFIHWNKKNSEVFVDVASLPAAPEGMQYQLWAIVDGKPMDMGVFDVTKEGDIQKMNSIAKASAFAVTLEKKGGSPTPSLEKMYVMGAV